MTNPIIRESHAWDRLLDLLKNRLPPEQFAGTKIAVAVSGGADSVAMLRLVFELWRQSTTLDLAHLVVAHFNHGLRGEASDGDQRFVDELAKSLGLTWYTETAVSRDDANPSRGGEAEFRAARYRFLQSTAERTGARYVFVAHTADDNVETMLHHLFRGTGTAGLAGISAHRSLGEDVVLVRPLLWTRRDELRAGLIEIGQSWRDDSSNKDDRYQRNWIRGTLLPLIRERYPNADDAMLRTIESQTALSEKIDQAADEWIARNIECVADAIIVTRCELDLMTLSAVVRSIWNRMKWSRQSITATHLRQLHAVIEGRVDEAFTLPGDVQCRVAADRVTFQRGRGEETSCPLSPSTLGEREPSKNLRRRNN